jgi:hypothetical protein
MTDNIVAVGSSGVISQGPKAEQKETGLHVLIFPNWCQMHRSPS